MKTCPLLILCCLGGGWLYPPVSCQSPTPAQRLCLLLPAFPILMEQHEEL